MTQRAFRARREADHEHVDRISTETILFIVAAAGLTLYELQLVLIPFVIAGVISYICAPAISLISAKARLPRPLAAVLVFLVLLAFCGVLGLLGTPPLIREVKHVVTDFQGTLDRLTKDLIGGGTVKLLGRPVNAQQLADAASQSIRHWVGNGRILTIIAGSTFVSGFAALLTIVLLFFFMISGPAIVRGLLWLVPPGQRPLIEDHILSNLDPVLRRYFIGVIAIVCFAAVFAYIGLGLVIGVPHALLLALLTGLLEAIPIVGPAAAAVIVGLVAIQHNFGFSVIVEFAIYLTALRLSIDQLFGPVILGAAGRVHPVLVIFCFLAGGALFGIVGVIIAIPVALVVKATLSVLYDEPQDALTDMKRH